MNIFGKLKNYQFERSQIAEYNKQNPKFHKIVFYAESKADWNYLGPVIASLNNDFNIPVSYLISDLDDAKLNDKSSLFKPYYIGNGSNRTILFKTISCKFFVMTLTDLGVYHLKKSIDKNTNYVYLFHSMASTHALYTEKAFDNYDIIFTVGPHHEKEIRKREKMQDLPKKELIKHGYGRLDQLLEKSHKQKNTSKKKILVAPSWGPSSITNRCAEKLVSNLLQKDFYVTFRPHPMSQWHEKKILKKLNNKFSSNENFCYEDNITKSNSLQDSSLLITDWSGIALEYAFTFDKPVISIDTPRKVNNTNYKKLNIPTLEDFIRYEIGDVLPENKIHDISEIARKLIKSYSNSTKIKKLRNKWVYNIGSSGKVGAQYLANRLNNKS